MLRERSNCRMTRVEPCELVEALVTPAITPNVRSRGVAVEAFVSGPGEGEACTMIVGKSTCGSGTSGNRV